ncbi:NlpC/P60 family protein [Palleronia caenipelagi]|uniref:NlpC/P60 family protein n=1 Tax=Palleronia caenipelagi TaxID=2489174 RepID=A0A547PW52_9RHOB|nr:NlpC/P60 family protein [Palleronia caenipelagi]TRD18352.1 NlpC/P60 family protein [Palleronia caenipelagi]
MTGSPNWPLNGPLNWSDAYIGIPYAEGGRTERGCDCYGLIRLIYARELGIGLPAYSAAPCATERAEIDRLVGQEAGTGPWTRVTDQAPFDVILCRMGALDSHLGLAVTPRLMLHLALDDCAKIERIDTGRWARRISSLWRHHESPTR